MAMEKESSEREKWEILKKAREATERAVMIRSELDAKEERIVQLEGQLRQVGLSEAMCTDKRSQEKSRSGKLRKYYPQLMGLTAI